MKKLCVAIVLLFAVSASAADWELTDPAADKLIGWDDSASAVVFFGLGTGLSFSATPTIDLHASLTSIAGLTETNGGIPYGTADNAYAWLAAGGAGKLLMGNGAGAPVWTTPTFPNAATTTGAYLRADGTNFIQSTLVLPNAGTAFKLPVFSAADTMTELAAVGSTGQILMGATGAIPAWSAFTLAAPGAAGGMLLSDGTNWTRATTLTGLTFDLGTAPASGAGAAVAVDADGILTTTITALLPDTAGGADLGSAAFEWGDVYLKDGAVIKGQNDQSATLTSSASTWTASAFTVTGTLTTNGATNIGDGGDDIHILLKKTTTNTNYNGIVVNLTCHETIAPGAPVFVNSDGEAALANATAASTMPAIGVAAVGGNAADTCTILTHGVMAATAWPNFTAGNTVYVDDSASGVLTATVGDVAGTDHVVQIIGIALGQDTVLINPSLSTITLE